MRAPYLDDGDLVLYRGDALDVLRGMPSGSADCCVTSPPYFGLRDYGTGRWEGGDAACAHRASNPRTDHSGGRGVLLDTRGEQPSSVAAATPMLGTCTRCGAVRVDQQVGLEDTPAAYVARLVEVFREVRRVLTNDGTLWLNLGDSYAANRSYQVHNTAGAGGHTYSEGSTVPDGLKPKDLVGIPWRVAFALQADGWYLRADIIWAKPNPMPESVRDRPTKAHEYVFLLSKSPRYWFDQEAVREALAPSTLVRAHRMGIVDPDAALRLLATEGTRKRGSKSQNEYSKKAGRCGDAGIRDSFANGVWSQNGRNIRSVWSIATKPYHEAHFAVFPEALPERCIKAGCPDGGTVLDPFCGSGTTLAVARKLGRCGVGIDLSADYLALAAKRTQQMSLLGGAA